MRKLYGIKKICAACVAFLMALAVFGASENDAALRTSADDAKEQYESQLEELKKQQNEIDAQIAQAQSKIDDENNNLEAINDKYKALKKKIKNIEEQTAELEDQMVDIDAKLRDSRYSLDKQNEEIEAAKADFMERVRAMYVAGGSASYENILVNSSDFYDILMRTELVKRVAKHDSDALDNLMEQKRQLEKTQKEVEEQSEQLKTKAQDYAEKQSELADEQAELLKMKEESGGKIVDLEAERDKLQSQSQSIAEDYDRISSLAETTTTKETSKTTTKKNSDNDGKTTTKKTEKQTTTTKKADNNDGTTTTKKQTATEAPETTQKPQTTTTSPSDNGGDNNGGDSSRQDKINAVIAYAKSNVGGAYVWGGSAFRACDCSGLIMISFAKAGISLPHYAASQASYGTTVSYSNLQPGDVVFFGGSSYSSIYHVALYIGDGRIVHAENSYTGIVISNLASFSIYNNITTIKRLL